MRFTLRQLEVFLATARHENITRAADALAMSQSAASGALRDLENLYDVQLFDRVGKRLQLNEFGRLLCARVEGLLEQAAELERSLLQHQEPGDLRIGATLTIGNYLAVGLMSRYMALHPGTRVDLQVANTAEIVREVKHYEMDMGLIEGEINDPELDIQPWRDDELVVFCAPDHPLAQRDTLDDADLLGARWILREPGSGTRQTFDRALHGLLPQLNVVLELQHTEAIKRATEAGLGIACLSRITLEDAFRRGSLVPLAVPHRDFSRQFYLILHRHKYRSAGLQRWLALCADQL